MSKPANMSLIGGFVLGATALLVVAVVFFGSGKLFSKTVPIVFYFEGSVKGLDVGAPLMIRGVKVGGVTSVQVHFDPKEFLAHSPQKGGEERAHLTIPVYAEFDPEKVVRVGGVKYQMWEKKGNVKKLIEHGLRGQLDIQSFVTGQLMINLDFMPYTEARLISKDPNEIEIPTVSTPLEELTQKLKKLDLDKIIDQMTSALEGIQEIVTSPGFQSGAKNMGPTLDELKKLTVSVNEEFKPFMKNTQNLMKNVDQLVTKVDRRFDPLVSKVEGALDDVGPVVSDLKKVLAKTDGTLDAARKMVDQVNVEMGPLTADLKKTLAEAHSAMARVQQTLDAAENNFFEGSEFYQTLTETLQQANEAARSAQALIEYLQRHPLPVTAVLGKGERR